MTLRRLPAFIDPDLPLAGTFAGEHGEVWVDHLPSADDITLDGVFTAAELRRFILLLEGKIG
jgi:hypothetical protein